MVRPSAIASLALSASLLFSAALAVAQTTGTAGKSATKKLVRREKPSSGWLFGFASWDEATKIKRQSDQRGFSTNSSLWALAVGRHWRIPQAGRFGWLIDAQLFYGQNATESRDKDLKFFKGNDSAYGANIGGGPYWAFFRPGVTLAATLDLMYRNVSYTAPAGYTFEPYASRVLYMAKAEFTFPLSPRVQLVQQFGVFLNENDHFWLLGIRL